MKNFLKFSAPLLAIAVLSGCGASAGRTTPAPAPATPVNGSISTPGLLFGTTTTLRSNVQSEKLAAATGAVYYIPVVNNGSGTLGVTKATTADTTGVWSVDAAGCSSVAVGSSCSVAVGFQGSGVSTAAQLSTVVTLTYSDGSTASFPVTGQVVQAGSLSIQMPSAVVPNESGVAYGVITMFNGESESFTVQAANILPNQDPKATWVFTPNCDGHGSSVIAANGSCSVGFVYTTTAAVSSDPVPLQVSVPVQNNVTGATVTPVLSATATPPANKTNPQPFLVYSGNGVSLLSGSATIALQNNGNGTLTGVTLSVLPSGVSSTNTCSNVVAGGVCAVTLTGTTTSSFTLAITPTNGSGSGLGNIQVSGQVIGASSSSVDFGSVFVGSTSSLQAISITNYTGAAIDISSVIGGTNAAQFNFGNAGCVSGSLPAFTACTAYLVYTASAAGLQNGTFTATTTGATQVVTLTGTGQTSAWNNLATLASYTSGSDVGASVLSLAMDPMSNLYIGNSFAQNVPGGRNVWELSPASTLGSWVNLTNLGSTSPLPLTGYVGSAPTALLARGVGVFIVGHFNGLVQSCIAGSECINAVNSTTTSGFGVTSLASLIDGSVTAGLVGYSNSTNGSTGQLGFIDESGVLTLISGVSSGIGKMAGDTSLVYVPLQSGALQTYSITNSSATLVSANVAPSQLTSGEFVTVVYDNESGTPTLYVGTSQGNVFSSPKPVTTGSWTQIATKLGGGNLFVSALGVDGSSIYAGLASLKNPSSGSGGVYVSLAGGTFTLDPAFSSKGDNSSVSSILIGNNSIYIGTMAGSVWQPK